MTQPAVLIVDDEPAIIDTFTQILRYDGYEVRSASSADEALQQLTSWPCDIAFVDIQLGTITGVDLLKSLKSSNPLLQVILITGRPEVETASEAVRLGASNYLSKPIHPNELLKTARNALNTKRLTEEAERHRSDLTAIFRSLSDGVMMLDIKGRLVQSNEAAARICSSLSRHLKDTEATAHLPCDGSCRQVIQESLRTGVPCKQERVRCRKPQKKSTGCYHHHLTYP